MKRLKSNNETQFQDQDRLSGLPDELILEILSFLEMRDVVRSTLVSKRWKDLWTTISHLDFNEYHKNSVQTLNFINGVLLHWKGTKILSFRIRFGEVYDASLSGDVDSWVSFATERNVEELNLWLPYNPYIKLGLMGYSIQIEHEGGNVKWDRLKSLNINGYCISEDLITQVVASTPHLEILINLLL